MTPGEVRRTHLQVRFWASACVRALAASAMSQDAATRYAALMEALVRPAGPLPDDRLSEPYFREHDIPRARDSVRDAAASAIGTLVALGDPWDRVDELLLALQLAWESDRRIGPGHGPAGVVKGAALPYGQCVAYQVARTHLCSLGSSDAHHGWLDYWDVLDALECLHPPLSMPPALPVIGIGRPVMYAAATAGITRLADYALHADDLAVARGRLERAWAAEGSSARV